MQLNEKQQQAVALITSPNFKSPFGLFGSAGTGKTSTMRHLPKTMQVAFVAPTNKAVSVLIESGCDTEHCMTIYSFLGLQVNEKTGKTTIDKKGRCKEWDYDVLVLDECSMANSDICNRLIALRSDLKIILMGDTAQLPPVGEKTSPAFELVRDNYIILTEQMRQANELNPMHKLLAAMRDSVDSGVMVDYSQYVGQVQTDNGKNGVVITRNANQFEAWIKGAFKRGDSHCAVVAWYNDRIDYFNAMIHEHLFPSLPRVNWQDYNPPLDSQLAYCLGETLTFQRAFKVGSDVLATNGSTVEVETVEAKQEKIIIGKFKVLLDCLLINGQFLTPCNRNEFNNWLGQLQNNLAANKEAGCDYSWGEFYLLREHFADLRHSYCITAVKSQGSTYDNVFIDIPNIQQMPEGQKEKNRCLYTAISRARHNVILLVQ
jgi:exodeoxyribonuclease-5